MKNLEQVAREGIFSQTPMVLGMTWNINYPASIDRCDLGTAAKVTPVKDMGTDRHHEEHEAWCVLRRQKKGKRRWMEGSVFHKSYVRGRLVSPVGPKTVLKSKA